MGERLAERGQFGFVIVNKPIAFMLDQNNEFPMEAVKKLAEMGKLSRVDGGAVVILYSFKSQLYCLSSNPNFTQSSISLLQRLHQLSFIFADTALIFLYLSFL